MRFLVVDGSPTGRRAVVSSLRRLGFDDVLEASDADEARERFDRSVDFLITEWRLPGDRGLDLVRNLRAEARRELPVLMIASRTAREDVVAAARMGVREYLVRPFDPDELRERIDRVLTAVPGKAR